MTPSNLPSGTESALRPEVQTAIRALNATLEDGASGATRRSGDGSLTVWFRVTDKGIISIGDGAYMEGDNALACAVWPGRAPGSGLEREVMKSLEPPAIICISDGKSGCVIEPGDHPRFLAKLPLTSNTLTDHHDGAQLGLVAEAMNASLGSSAPDPDANPYILLANFQRSVHSEPLPGPKYMGSLSLPNRSATGNEQQTRGLLWATCGGATETLESDERNSIAKRFSEGLQNAGLSFNPALSIRFGGTAGPGQNILTLLGFDERKALATAHFASERAWAGEGTANVGRLTSFAISEGDKKFFWLNPQTRKPSEHADRVFMTTPRTGPWNVLVPLHSELSGQLSSGCSAPSAVLMPNELGMALERRAASIVQGRSPHATGSVLIEPSHRETEDEQQTNGSVPDIYVENPEALTDVSAAGLESVGEQVSAALRTICAAASAVVQNEDAQAEPSAYQPPESGPSSPQLEYFDFDAFLARTSETAET